MRVLYIEDKATNIHVMQRVAQVVQCELLLASSGQAGLALLREQPAVIFTDIGLSDLGGPLLIQRLREGAPDTPIIAVTAHVLPGDREQCLAAGCTAYVAKPFKFAAMVALFKRYQATADSR